MSKIINLKFLIIGLRGLGIEVAKNLILAGPKEVSICDKNICKINDLGSNFYVSEGDVNKKTLEDSCYEKLKCLNPYVKVTRHKGLNKEDIKRFDVIIITEIMKLEDLYELNNFTRKNNINFIYSLNLGLTGFLFNDFGENHIIYDFNGKKKLSYEIVSIKEKENRYEIYINIKDDEQIGIIEGDYVIFKKVKGLEFLNDSKPRKIIKTTNSSFEIEKEKKAYGKYISDGIIEEAKKPEVLKFKSFKDNFLKPNDNFNIIDKKKKGSNILLHCSFIGLHIYYSIFNQLPELNNSEQTNEIVELSNKYYSILEKQYEKSLEVKKKHKKIEKVIFDINYIKNVIKWSKAEISPICSFLGGIVSQEALKITGKYKPIHQWLRFDFFETIENLPENVNRNPLNCRYDDQISVFGQELQEKLGNLNIFMVGAGALGCEYIKNFALMGISCKNGKLTITDNDNISLSNLNRQFLFHKSDVKENSSKSFCAKREALKINKYMNIKDYQLLINDDTRDIFNDEFIEKQNILVSAVDNILARKYIDNLSTFFNKIYINSGTEGIEADSHIFYPNKSICLNDMPFSEKKEIPECTLKSFPTKIEHCIEFSKNIFKELFEQCITDIKLLFEDEQHFYNILENINNPNQLYLILEIYKNIFHVIENKSLYTIIKYAFFIFIYYFEYIINKLLKEHATSNINKRPSPLKIDLTDGNTILYFKSFFYIISDIINLDEEFNIETIKTVIKQEKIFINEDIFDRETLIKNFEKEISHLKIDNKVKEGIKSMKQIIFEKDNDNNYHINFILSFSNLRANNYNIENTDFLNAKEIAGNIIPAIASTTAAITGISCLQIYTLLQTDNLMAFRNADLNLGIAIFDLYVPGKKIYIDDFINDKDVIEKKVVPRKFTVWDKIDIIGPNKTVKNIVDDFKEKYNVDIYYINYNCKLLSSPSDPDDDCDKTIESLLKENNEKYNEKQKYIELEIFGLLDGIKISTPKIRYNLKGDNKEI
jgi:ubiquitin-activating enzyme E1